MPVVFPSINTWWLLQLRCSFVRYWISHQKVWNTVFQLRSTNHQALHVASRWVDTSVGTGRKIWLNTVPRNFRLSHSVYPISILSTSLDNRNISNNKIITIENIIKVWFKSQTSKTHVPWTINGFASRFSIDHSNVIAILVSTSTFTHKCGTFNIIQKQAMTLTINLPLERRKRFHLLPFERTMDQLLNPNFPNGPGWLQIKIMWHDETSQQCLDHDV